MAEFLRMVEARSAATNGKFIHPVYENRHINVSRRTAKPTIDAAVPGCDGYPANLSTQRER